MDVITVALLLILLLWVVFCFGVVHLFRAWTLHREKKQGGQWVPGREGSPTSNSKTAYKVNVTQIEAKGFHVKLHGTLSGSMPGWHEVTYLEAGEHRVPVMITRIREDDMPDAEQGVRLCIRLAGVPRSFRQRIAAADGTAFTVTNLRRAPAPKANGTATARPDEEPDAEKQPESAAPQPPVELHYPIVVRSPLREILPAAALTVLAIVFSLMGIAGYSYLPGDGSMIAFMVIGLLMLALGLFWLCYVLGFQLTVDRNQVSVRRFFRTTVYHIDNLRYRAHLATDASEKWWMDITNRAGGKLASINSSYRHYGEILEAFQQAAKRQNEEKKNAVLRGYLTNTGFRILGIRIRTESQEIVMPNVLTKKENGATTLFLFDNEAEARRNYPNAPLIPAKLMDAIAMKKELKADIVSIWAPDKNMKPLEVTDELLHKLQIDTAES